MMEYTFSEDSMNIMSLVRQRKCQVIDKKLIPRRVIITGIGPLTIKLESD